MSRTRRDIVKMVAAASVLPFAPALAQTWPSPRVRFLVGTAAGGSPDVVGRMVCEKLSEKIGASIYVENVTTAAGAVSYRLERTEPQHACFARRIRMNRKPQPEADQRTSKEIKEKPSQGASPPTPEQVNDAVDKHRAAVPGKASKNKGSIG